MAIRSSTGKQPRRATQGEGSGRLKKPAKSRAKNRPKVEKRPSKINLKLSAKFWWLLLLLVVVAGWGGLQYAPQLFNIEIEPIELEPVMVRHIQLKGKLIHVDAEQVKQLVHERGQQGILVLDPEQLRGALEALPWIYQASVRKLWPDQLEIHIEEQRAAVLWGEQGYLNLDGVYFDAAGIKLPEQKLPLISSHQQDTEAVYQQLQQLMAILSKQSTASTIVEMAVDRRGAVTLHLQDGLLIHLGRRAITERLQRWVDQVTVVSERYKGQLKGVDLRYERGMVLQLQPKQKSKSVKR
ncbi:MAG: FtsQ-type POTRA domain-containing protein [Gammaproteobacteria bacterium]|jgi:cell division protein FtsQ|nr:FtsQ-type POTRA domain-containing protein [Gammaproteobacteria bacterium]MBT4606272.1 FtsQ-type POTRA domain-containing protein [Thiotrichales bacterium]MBT3472230.1 FtsQ-type POTRA domain-containing protein [Gammaproteobacteria bacterium]MBT3968644.1 FtsQ-type POTRA domain-containing protein [Gammaproteobacteria bacterium]MBT4331180.1 FtsQ-type POTRA domain-containing protein [Gammaproteobacteria bacterium]